MAAHLQQALRLQVATVQPPLITLDTGAGADNASILDVLTFMQAETAIFALAQILLIASTNHVVLIMSTKKISE